MEQRQRGTLDSDVLRARLRGYTPRHITTHTGDSKRNQGFTISDTRQPQGRILPPANTKPATLPSTRLTQPTETVITPRHRHVPIATKTAPAPAQTSHKKSHTKRRSVVTASLVAIPIIAGTGLWAITLQTNHRIVAQVKAIQATATNTDGSTNDSPTNPVEYDETPPTNINSYVVAPDLPRYIIIDKLNIKARVKRMGVGTDNAIQAPKNIFDAGWYDGSAKPGETGATFIDGHVSGPTQRGVFYKLKSLETGDSIVVEKGDGSRLVYVVASSESYPANRVDMNKALRPYGDARKGLTLMTCSGSFDRATQEYTERIIVYAILR